MPADVAGRKDRSSRLDRKVAAVVAAAVTDAFNQGLMTGESGVGLRGGSYAIEFGDEDASVDLDAIRFAGDVAISGHATRSLMTGVIDAQVTVDGPRGEDGSRASRARGRTRGDDAAHRGTDRAPRDRALGPGDPAWDGAWYSRTSRGV